MLRPANLSKFDSSGIIPPERLLWETGYTPIVYADGLHYREPRQMKQHESRKIELFDTSLRDGLQQPNLDISVQKAVGLLERMSAFGVRYAEIGFAGANQFVADLAGALEGVDAGGMRLALFGRTRGRGT